MGQSVRAGATKLSTHVSIAFEPVGTNVRADLMETECDKDVHRRSYITFLRQYINN